MTKTLLDIRDANLVCPAKRKNRRDRLNALARYAAMLGSPLDQIPCDVRAISARMDEAVEARPDIDAADLGRLRDDVMSAIRASRLLPAFATRKHELARGWPLIVATAKTHGHDMRRAACWADLSGLAPQQIGDTQIEAYREALVEVGKAPYRALLFSAKFRDGLTAVADQRPDLEIANLAEVVTDERPILYRPSPTYVASVEDYLDDVTVADGEPFGTRTLSGYVKISTTSAATLRKVLATAADAVGVALGTVEGLDRLTRFAEEPMFAALIEGLGIRGAGHPSKFNRAIVSSVLTALEKLGIEVPRNLTKLRDAMPVPPPGLSPKTLDQLQGLLSVEKRTALLNAPSQLWQEAKGTKKADVALLRFQVSVALALLLATPLWSSELLALAYGVNLDISPPRAVMTLPSLGRPITLSAETSDMLRALHAVLMSATGHAKYLFATTKAGTESARARFPASLSKAIADAVQRLVGLRLTPTTLRFVPGLLLLIADPDDIVGLMHLYGYDEAQAQLVFRAVVDFARKLRSKPAASAGLTPTPNSQAAV